MNEAKRFLEENNLTAQFRGLMMDGKYLTMHSDRWSFVYDWVESLGKGIEKPNAIETKLTELWEAQL